MMVGCPPRSCHTIHVQELSPEAFSHIKLAAQQKNSLRSWRLGETTRGTPRLSQRHKGFSTKKVGSSVSCFFNSESRFRPTHYNKRASVSQTFSGHTASDIAMAVRRFRLARDAAREWCGLLVFLRLCVKLSLLPLPATEMEPRPIRAYTIVLKSATLCILTLLSGYRTLFSWFW